MIMYSLSTKFLSLLICWINSNHSYHNFISIWSAHLITIRSGFDYHDWTPIIGGGLFGFPIKFIVKLRGTSKTVCVRGIEEYAPYENAMPMAVINAHEDPYTRYYDIIIDTGHVAELTSTISMKIYCFAKIIMFSIQKDKDITVHSFVCNLFFYLIR